MSHFSDEFIAYAKEEDEINHQHTSNWIACYVIITLIPVVFIGCAWWSNRQRKAAKAAHRRGTCSPLLSPSSWPRRLPAGRNHRSTDNHAHQARTESIEMKDLEAARAPALASPATTAWPETGTGTGMGTRTAPPPPPPKSRSRAAGMASDTGAPTGGDEFEDVDLAEGGASSWWQQRGGRKGPVPSFLRKTALPGESSAFKFQPEGAGWPRCEDIVLVQPDGPREHTEERSEWLTSDLE